MLVKVTIIVQTPEPNGSVQATVDAIYRATLEMECKGYRILRTTGIESDEKLPQS